MNNNNSYAYAEVLDVLDNMEEIYIKKIPNSFIEYLKENASLNYQKHISTSIPLEKQKLNNNTLTLLAIINLKYWVDSEEHKQKLLAQYRENDKKILEKLEQPFVYDSIFSESKEKNIQEEKIKESNTEDSKKLSTNLPAAKRSIFRKFIDFIMSKIFEN